LKVNREDTMDLKKKIGNFLLRKDKNLIADLLLLIVFVTIGTFSRTILVGYSVQPFPNFEIIMVLTFIAAVIFKSTIAFFVPLFSMILSDILLGNPILVGAEMNRIVLFTYSGFALIALISIMGKKKLSKTMGGFKLKNIGIASCLGIVFVLIYDVWTNIGWWYLIYPHNIKSLSMVFAAGVPFMIYHMISGAITFTVIALPVLSFLKMKNRSEVSLPKPKNIYRLPSTLIAISLIILSFTGTAMKIPEKTEIWLENSDQTSVKISIIGYDFSLDDNIAAYKDDTVYSILKEFCNRNDILLKTKYYEQFDSLLIEAIGTCANGEFGKYWQYYVYSFENGSTPPMVGCDKYEIYNGDVVEWRFEEILY
jgi:hypothetical protein